MDYKKIKDFLKKFLTKNNTKYLIVLFLIGVLLIVTASFFKGGSSNTVQTSGKAEKESSTQSGKDDNDNMDAEEKQLQADLKATLEQMDGVGRTKVMMYFESGKEEVPAVNSTDSVSDTQEKDTSGGTRNTTQHNNGSTVVVTNDNNGSGNTPLIVKTIKPKITGVVIVAEGAQDKKIQLEITEAVVSLFNISYDKVNVYPMKK